MKAPKQPKYRMARCLVRDLIPHPEAQRLLRPKRVKYLVDNLDLGSIGLVHVVRCAIHDIRAFWIVDGQHRMAALRAAGLEEIEVDIKVHLDVEDAAGAATLFRNLNNRYTVHPTDMFRTALVAHHEPECSIEALLQKHGLHTGRANGKCVIGCVTTLMRAYKLDAGKSLDAALGILIKAFGKESATYETHAIAGVTGFCFQYPSHDTPKLTRLLSTLPNGTATLLGGARHYKTLGHAKSMGQAATSWLTTEYNKRRRIKLAA